MQPKQTRKPTGSAQKKRSSTVIGHQPPSKSKKPLRLGAKPSQSRASAIDLESGEESSGDTTHEEVEKDYEALDQTASDTDSLDEAVAQAAGIDDDTDGWDDMYVDDPAIVTQSGVQDTKHDVEGQQEGSDVSYVNLFSCSNSLETNSYM